MAEATATQANEKAREARKEQIKQAEARVKEAHAQREKTNTEAIERMEKTKPTPTQEENDKAANGISVEEHEYDGSPPQGITPEDAAAAAKHYKQPEDRAYVGSKRVEGGKTGQYATRQTTAKPA